MIKIFRSNVHISFGILVLNILDSVLTTIGLLLGGFEANWFMRALTNDFFIFISIKILAPYVLLCRLYIAYRRCKNSMKKIINISLKGLFSFYILIIAINIVSIIAIVAYNVI